MDQKTAEMLTINLEQKRYYEVASGGSTHATNSAGTNWWRELRARALGVFAETNRRQSIDDLHRRWIGDVSDLKVLDLGVGSGNSLTLELAQKAKEYVAIDLSQSRIDSLRESLNEAGVKGGRLYAADFLSDEFKEGYFDLIYAQAVFHHFKHLDAFLTVVETKLTRGGRVVTYDPVKVWWPIVALRGLYRPFQTDAAWEHPFNRRALSLIESRFDVIDCQGIMGKSKWASVVGLFSPSAGKRLAQKWHDDDMRDMTNPAALRRCLHASYHLRRR